MASKESKPLISVPVLIILLVLPLAGGLVWYLEKAPAAPAQGPVLTPEAKTYVRNLKLADVTMKATENTVHAQLVEIEGQITNAGDRALKSVLLYCIFYDAYNQVVLKEKVEIIKAKFGGIKPGETKTFRLPFDTLPPSWNQAMPQLVIAEIVFG